MTSKNKKPLFDRVKWESLLDVLTCPQATEDQIKAWVLGNYNLYDKQVGAIEAFINDSIRKGQREVVMEVLEEFEQTLDDSGNASWTMAFADTIDRIRAKYQE